MVPPPHPQLGKKETATGQNKNGKNNLLYSFHVFIFKDYKNSPKMVPRLTPHPRLGKQHCHEAQQIEKNTYI